MVAAKRFEVWHVELNPTIGSEINKIRPCLIVSPDETNRFLNTVIIVPLTSTKKPYPTRLDCKFMSKESQLVVDQLRIVDKVRLIKKLGKMDNRTNRKICDLLSIMFQYE